MNQPRIFAAVTIVAILLSMTIACTKEKPVAGGEKTGNPHNKPIHIKVNGDQCSIPSQEEHTKLSKKNQEFATWKITPSSVTDTYVVIFKSDNTPCDNGLGTAQKPLTINGSADESTACTVQKADGSLDGKPYPYSIKKTGATNNCIDPSVDVQN